MGNEGIYWKESAKMLAGLIHLMRGTPYIYQGEEIGMLNAYYPSIDQYRDVESLNYYQILLEKGKTKEEALTILSARSRDNSRTPVQWNYEKYGGFSETEPWLPMSAKFEEEVTVEAQKEDEDSVLAFYKRLITMRKEFPVIAKGRIRFLETDTDMTLVYERVLDSKKVIVICNLGEKEQKINIDPAWRSYREILCNYSEGSASFQAEMYMMRPYELAVFEN